MKNVLATALALGIVATTLLPAIAGEECAAGKECAGKSMACNSKDKAQGGSPASSASTEKKDEAVAKVEADKTVVTPVATEKKEEAKTK